MRGLIRGVPGSFWLFGGCVFVVIGFRKLRYGVCSFWLGVCVAIVCFRRCVVVDKGQVAGKVVHRLEAHLQAGADGAAEVFAIGVDQVGGEAGAGIDHQHGFVGERNGVRQ